MSGQAENIEDRIREIIVERLFLEINPAELGAGVSLTIEHGVDSVRLFDMIVGLEDDFGISFEDDELLIQNFDSVAAIASRVREKAE